MTARAFLLPIADCDALAWIVTAQRTAFGENRARDASALTPGDVLFLYTTRSCFRNPTRDRGKVVGRATVHSVAQRAEKAPSFGGREFPHVVELEIATLAPLREGLELAPLVPLLNQTFPDARTWSARMRRALVSVDPSDAAELERRMKSSVRPYQEALPSYEAIGGHKPARSGGDE